MTNRAQMMFAGVSALVLLIGGILIGHASPFWPPTGTDLQASCGTASPSSPLPVATDGTSFSCWPTWPNSYVFAVGAPVSRSISVGTAYQASTNTKPAIETFSIKSTAAISLSGGTTNQVDVYVSATNTVGSGQLVCEHGNSNTGTLTIGLNLSTISTTPCSFLLPAGYYFSVVNTQGSGSIIGASDQTAG